MSEYFGGTNDMYGEVRASIAEQREHENSLFAKRIMRIPSNLQARWDYTGSSDGQPIYAGFAARGIAANEEGWLLHKFTYDANGFITLRQIAYNTWDNRTGATYA